MLSSKSYKLAMLATCISAFIVTGCGGGNGDSDGSGPVVSVPPPPALHLRSVAYATQGGYQPATRPNGSAEHYGVLPTGVIKIEIDGFENSAFYAFRVCIQDVCPEGLSRDDFNRNGEGEAWHWEYDGRVTQLFFYITPAGLARRCCQVRISIQAVLNTEQPKFGPALNLTLVSRKTPQPEPEPTPRAIVPTIVGLTAAEARSILDQVGLGRNEFNLDPTTSDPTKLVVVSQDPAGGTEVTRGYAVLYSVKAASPPPGWGSIQITNRHMDQRALTIHLWSPGTGWKKVGDPLEFGKSESVPLATNIYYLVAVDLGLVGCNDGAPENLSCQRYALPVSGESGGRSLSLGIQ